MTARPSESPAWYDLTLGAMGATLAAGFGAGWFSAVPLRITGCLGALLATVVIVGSTAWRPPVD